MRRPIGKHVQEVQPLGRLLGLAVVRPRGIDTLASSRRTRWAMWTTICRADRRVVDYTDAFITRRYQHPDWRPFAGPSWRARLTTRLTAVRPTRRSRAESAYRRLDVVAHNLMRALESGL